MSSYAGGGAAAPSKISRHLSLLLNLSSPEILSQPAARKSRQRLHRRVHRVDDLNSVIDCLNWMAGKSQADQVHMDDMKQMVIGRLEWLVERQQPSSDLLSSKAALRQLLRCRDYTGMGSASGLASYRPGLVSLPAGDFSECPQLCVTSWTRPTTST